MALLLRILFHGTFRSEVPEMPPIIISLVGILKMLAGLDPTKAAGPDTIKPIVLRSSNDQVAPMLQVILQKSLDSGQIPSDWKKAIVSHLFKKGDKCDPADYRPFSLTCICCKLMEHVVTYPPMSGVRNDNIHHLQPLTSD